MRITLTGNWALTMIRSIQSVTAILAGLASITLLIGASPLELAVGATSSRSQTPQSLAQPQRVPIGMARLSGVVTTLDGGIPLGAQRGRDAARNPGRRGADRAGGSSRTMSCGGAGARNSRASSPLRQAAQPAADAPFA